MSNKPIKTTMPLLEVQCPACGAEQCEYVDDLEWDLEQHRCSRCGQVFNVRWEREIRCIGWEDAEGLEHEVWNTDLIVAVQTEAMYHVCWSLWKHYGDQCPPGVERHVWDVLCAAMQCIECDLPKQEHEFKPVALGDRKKEEDQK